MIQYKFRKTLTFNVRLEEQEGVPKRIIARSRGKELMIYENEGYSLELTFKPGGINYIYSDITDLLKDNYEKFV